jgi:hypothetical protein
MGLRLSRIDLHGPAQERLGPFGVMDGQKLARVQDGIVRWISTAQRMASVTLAKPASVPSPVSMKTRPACRAISGSTSSARSRRRSASVRSSSSSIMRL